MTPQRYILLGFGIAVAILLGFLVVQRCARESQGEPVTPRVDTLFIRDTNTFTEPKTEPSAQVVTKEIPIPVYLADSSVFGSVNVFVSRIANAIVCGVCHYLTRR